MKYTYQFADETVTVEVGGEWVAILEKEDRREYNNRHANTRRHCSLSNYDPDGSFLPSGAHVEAEAIARLEGTAEDENIRRLYRAIEKLGPEQRDLVMRVLLGGMKKLDYAAEKGVSPAAVTKRIDAVLKKIKKIF